LSSSNNNSSSSTNNNNSSSTSNNTSSSSSSSNRSSNNVFVVCSAGAGLFFVWRTLPHVPSMLRVGSEGSEDNGAEAADRKGSPKRAWRRRRLRTLAPWGARGPMGLPSQRHKADGSRRRLARRRLADWPEGDWPEGDWPEGAWPEGAWPAGDWPEGGWHSPQCVPLGIMQLASSLAI